MPFQATLWDFNTQSSYTIKSKQNNQFRFETYLRFHFHEIQTNINFHTVNKTNQTDLG